MTFEYLDILEKLKESGYNTFTIRKEKIFSESVLTKFRKNQPVSILQLVKVCELTNRDISDIIKLKK